MPKITCPYCKIESPSKFIHKQHLRQDHTQLFNNNIKTCLTGAICEVQEEREDVILNKVDAATSTDCSIMCDSNGMDVEVSEYNIQEVSSVTHGEDCTILEVVVNGQRIKLRFPSKSIMMVNIGNPVG